MHASIRRLAASLFVTILVLPTLATEVGAQLLPPVPDGFDPALHYVPESATANTPFAGIPIKQVCGCPDGPRQWSLTGADFDEAEATPTGWTTRDFLETATGTALPGGLTPEDVRPPQSGSVNLAIGEFVGRFTVLEIPMHKGPDFEFTLTHRSIGYADGNRHLGPHWDASFLRYIEWQNQPGTSNLLLNTGDARTEVYTRVGAGVWHGPPGTFSQIVQNAATGNYDLTDKVGNRLVFMPPTTAPGGYVLRMEDSAGQGFSFDYAPYPARIDVTSAHGHVIRMHFSSTMLNPGGTRVLERIEDVFAAREVNLGYVGGPPFLLERIETPVIAGVWATTTFGYAPTLPQAVSDITDNNGILYLHNEYDPTGRVRSQHLVNGQFWEFIYQYLAGTTQVVDPRGSIEQWTFDPTLRSMPVQRVQPPNPMLRPDPTYTTTYQPNAFREFTRVVFPRGNLVEFEWKGTRHPGLGPTFDGDLMHIRKDPGPVESPSGLPPAAGPVGSVNKGAMEFEIRWHALHQPAAVVDPRGIQAGFVPPNEGSASPSRYTTEFLYGGTGQKLSNIHHATVNPSGLPAPGLPFTGAYALQASTQSFDYNGAGQLIKHTDVLGKQHTRDHHTSAGVPRNGYLSASTVDATGLGITSSYTYDTMGNVATVIDPDGNTWTYAHDIRCNVVESLAPFPLSYQTLYEYDGNSNLQSVRRQKDTSSPDYTTRTFSYDEYDRLTAIRTDASLPPAPPGSTIVQELFVYDANGNLVFHATPEVEAETFRYDARNLPFEHAVYDDANHASLSLFWYDANGNPRVVRDGLGNETWSWSDGFDRPGFTVDPLGTVRNNVYDPVGNLVYSEVRAPQTATPTGPGPGAVTDAQVIQKSTQATQRMSLAVQYHDEKSRRYRLDQEHIIHDAAAAALPAPTTGTLTPGDAFVTTAWEPDAMGQVLHSMSDNLAVHAFTWDGASRLDFEVDAVGNRIDYVYDHRGNLIETTTTEVDEAGSTVAVFGTFQGFDEAGRLEWATDPSGDTSTFEYDGRDNLVRSIDRVGNVTEYEYDDGDRLRVTTLQDPATGATVTIGQDLEGFGRVAQRCDGAGGCTTFQYDTARDLLVEEQHPDGVVVEHEYDDNGRLVRTRDNRGRTMHYVRDPRGDVTLVAVDDPSSSGTKTQTFQRDALGRVTSFTDDGLAQFQQTAALGPVVSTLGYDSFDRVVSELQSASALTVDPVLYVRDGVGNVVQTVYPNGRIVDRSFDKLGRVQQVSDPKGIIAQYDYEGQARVAERRGGGVRTSIDVDPDRRVERIEHRDMASTALHLGVRYHYDAADRPRAAVNLRSGVLSERYEVDHLGRMRLWERGTLDPVTLTVTSPPCNDLLSGWDFTLDDAGNWASHERTTRDAGCVASSEPYGRNHSPANEVGKESHPSTPTGFACEAGPAQDQCLYDLEGALINDGELRYEYDFNKRLVQVTNGLGQPIVYYGYDALGRKAVRAELENGVLTDLHHFTYSGWNVMQHHRTLLEMPMPLPPNEFLTIRQWTWGPGLDEPIEMSVDENDDKTTTDAADARYHYHLDAQGSVLGLTEPLGSGARVVEGYLYEPYGTPTAFRPGPNGVVDWGGDDEVRHNTESGLGNPLLYHGMWWEDLGRPIDTELYYARARHLHPELGRFVSRDPMGIWGDPLAMGNPYLFAGDNPAAMRDPFGLCSWGKAWRCVDDGLLFIGEPMVYGVGEATAEGLWWLRDDVFGSSAVETNALLCDGGSGAAASFIPGTTWGCQLDRDTADGILFNEGAFDYATGALDAVPGGVALKTSVRGLRHVDEGVELVRWLDDLAARADEFADVAKAGPGPGEKLLLGPGTSYGAKIEGQLAKRGWTKSLVQSTIDDPARTVPWRDTRHLPGGGFMDDPATGYYSTRGGYVVRNDRTGDIVQVSNRYDPNWRAPWD